jgi:hypothetical protein
MDIARLAYIYGLPCYEVARLRYRALSLPRKAGPLRLNTFLHTRALSTPVTAVVTAVNSDTLLSRAWIDLSRGPLIVHLPDTADRYYSLALMDVFTNNFAVSGRRTTGTAAGQFLLAGPQWDGAAPAGMKAIRAPTNAVWALARILVDGPGDVAAVHAIQDQFAISRWGAPTDAASWSRDPLSWPVPPLDNDKPLIFFDVLNAMLTENPPPAQDEAVLDRLRAIGVGPSFRFSRQHFTPPQREALRHGLASGRDTIRAQVGFRTLGPQRTGFGHWPSDALLAQLRGPIDASRHPTPGDRRLGWSGPLGNVGNFGSDYLLRAQCALAGLGLLPREEAMYFSTATDAIGAPLNGRSRYVLRFPPAGLPPVDAFWSLTIYQTDENNRRWLAPNPIDRYSLGNRKSDLCYGGDGSLEIFIEHDAPTSGEENWLPAPDAPFLLTLRAYQPRRALLDGRYSIPEVQRRSESE